MEGTEGNGQLKGSKKAKVRRQKEKRRCQKEGAARAAEEEVRVINEARARAENERMQLEDAAIFAYEEAQQALVAMDK